MSYRTKRPRVRALLTFGVGATLAITQLGAGCVPARSAERCGADAAPDENGNCVGGSGDSGSGSGDTGADK